MGPFPLQSAEGFTPTSSVVSPYHHHRCLAQKLVFPHSLSLLLCKTQILPHHSAATQDSHINPHRTETGCSSPHSITAAPAGHSFSFWLPLAMSLFAVKAHVIPRRKGHAEARNPQADRHGEMNPVFQEGCRADGSVRASVTWRGGDGLQVCQETPGHRAGRARADERNEQVLTKKTFSVVSLPRGASVTNPLISAGSTPGSELAVHFTLGKLRGTQTSVSSRSSREAGLHHREKK